jgi:heptosyltransferase-3
VDLTGGDRAAIFSFLSGARYRLAYNLSRDTFWGKSRLYTHLASVNGNEHMVLQNLQVVRQFGIDTGNLDVDLFIPEDASRFVRDVFEENRVSEDDVKVHVHPPSRWLFKCWQDERMAEVITWLLEQGIKVIVTSAPEVKELNKAKRILSLVKENSGGKLRPIDLCGRTSIKELAAITTAADLFFGVDSAPMHIAAAVGTPVVALFGPSYVNRWAPWSSELSSLKTREDWAKCYRNDCYYLGKHTVAQRNWQCFPCGKDGCEGSKRSKCLEDISVKEVKDLILARLPRIRRDAPSYS